MIRLFGDNPTPYMVTKPKKCPACGCKDIRMGDGKRAYDVYWTVKKYEKPKRPIFYCFHCDWWIYQYSVIKNMINEVTNLPNILHPRKGSLCVYFPFTTCGYSTTICRVACLAKKEAHPNNDVKREVLKYFSTLTPDILANRLLFECLREKDSAVLHWFASGDCPKSDLFSHLISTTMEFLKKAGITQCGFTRNPKLIDILSFDKDYKDTDKLRIFLTVEKYWDKDMPSESEISDHIGFDFNCLTDLNYIAVPDYEKDMTDLYLYSYTGRKTWYAGSCGSSGGWNYKKKYKQIWMERWKLNCYECSTNKRGCFAVRRSP